MNKFKERLAHLIQSSGKTQNQISSEMNVIKQKLSQWKNGYIEPNIDDLIRIASYFQTSIDYLVGYESEDGNRTTNEEIEYWKIKRSIK